ncbi:hypothetical protein AK824_09885 [Psychrobacter sp. P11G3]|nr:hypothetical protein AK824_09885 [Psychrobacter sp. P11G3]
MQLANHNGNGRPKTNLQPPKVTKTWSNLLGLGIIAATRCVGTRHNAIARCHKDSDSETLGNYYINKPFIHL